MGRDHKSQRTKGSVKPSSSSHIATLLTTDTKNLSTAGGNAFLQAQANFNDDNDIDPEIRLTLKKLAKKDPVTKVKALESLIESTKQDESLPATLLDYFVKVYPKLSQDENRKVRELGNVLLGTIGTSVGRDLAPYLKVFMPFLVFSMCDCYATVSSTAESAFQAIFPEDKRQKSLKFAQEEIVATIRTNIQQIDTTAISEENANFRMAYSSIKAVLYLSDNEVLPKEMLDDFIKIKGFVVITRNFNSGPVCQLRRLAYDILTKATPQRKVIEECLTKETSVEAIPNLWNCFMSLSVTGSLDSEFIKKHLIDCCENGLYGSDGLGLGVLPVVAYVQQESFSLNVIQALIQGYNKTRSKQILRTIMEIFSYVTKSADHELLQEETIFPFIVSTNFAPELATSISQLIKSDYFYKNFPNYVARDEKILNTPSFGQFVSGIVIEKKSVRFDPVKSTEIEENKKYLLISTCKIAIESKSYDLLKVITRKFSSDYFWEDVGEFDCPILSINLDMLKSFPHKVEKVKEILVKTEFSQFVGEIMKFENLPVVLQFYRDDVFTSMLIRHCSSDPVVNLRFVLRPVFQFTMNDLMKELLQRDDILYGEISSYDVDMTQICIKLTKKYIESRLNGEEVEFESLLLPGINYSILSEFIMQDSDKIFQLAKDIDIVTPDDLEILIINDSLYACYGLSSQLAINVDDEIDTTISEEKITTSLKLSILYCKWNMWKEQNLNKCLKYLMESLALVEIGSRLNFDLGICSDELEKIWDKIKHEASIKIPKMERLPTRLLRHRLKVGSAHDINFHIFESNCVEKCKIILDSVFVNYGDYSEVAEWLMTERKQFPKEFQFDLLYKDVEKKEKLILIVKLVEFLLDKCEHDFVTTSACWISAYLKNCKTVTRTSLNVISSLARVVSKLQNYALVSDWTEFNEFFAANFYPVIYSQFFQLMEMSTRDFYVRAALFSVADCLSGIPKVTLAFIQPDSKVLVDEFGKFFHDQELFIKECCYEVLKKVDNASGDLPIVPTPFISLFKKKKDLVTYYLAWDSLLTIQSASIEFANFVKQSHLLPQLLDSLFFETLTMTNEYLKQYFEADVNLKSINLIHLACQLLQKTLRTLPYTVRWWWNSELTKQRDKVHVDKFVKTFLSSKLAAEELGRVQWQKELDNVEINCHPGCNELIARYKIEETTVALTISLPLNHPLGPVIVTISDKKLHARISHLLNCRSHSLAAGLKLWKENLDGVYKDVDECAICFFILHHVNKSVPKLACKTCKKKYHSACLYKWFNTSNKSECPLCRNLF